MLVPLATLAGGASVQGAATMLQPATGAYACAFTATRVGSYSVAVSETKLSPAGSSNNLLGQGSAAGASRLSVAVAAGPPDASKAAAKLCAERFSQGAWKVYD